MIKLKQILSEGVMSPLLYHITSISRALNILEENQFRLTPAYGTSSDMKNQKGKLYFLSTSRIKYGGYSRSLSDVGNVNFELDGRKLNQNYTSVNVDYWGDKWRSIEWEKGNYQRFLRHDENEERVITDNPNIKPAAKFIKSMHVSVGDPKELRNFVRGALVELDKEANKKNIDIFYYTDPESWKLHNERKAKRSIDKLIDFKGDFEKSEMTAYDKKIKGIISLFNSESPDDLNDEGKALYDKLKYGQVGGMDSLESQIENEIHNYKSTPQALDRIAKVSSIMKKNNINSVNGLVQLMSKKATKLRRKDLEDLRNEYDDLVEAVKDIYSVKNDPVIRNLSRRGHIDTIFRYFGFDRGPFNSWTNKAQEKAFRVVNDLEGLMDVGYFKDLEDLIRSENNTRLLSFLKETIKPILDQMAENEGFINYGK